MVIGICLKARLDSAFIHPAFRSCVTRIRTPPSSYQSLTRGVVQLSQRVLQVLLWVAARSLESIKCDAAIKYD